VKLPELNLSIYGYGLIIWLSLIITVLVVVLLFEICETPIVDKVINSTNIDTDG